MTFWRSKMSNFQNHFFHSKIGQSSLLGSKDVRKHQILKVKGQGQNLGHFQFFFNFFPIHLHSTFKFGEMTDKLLLLLLPSTNFRYLDLLLRYSVPKLGQTPKILKFDKYFFQNVAFDFRIIDLNSKSKFQFQWPSMTS